jgi:hypothetical protein
MKATVDVSPDVSGPEARQPGSLFGRDVESEPVDALQYVLREGQELNVIHHPGSDTARSLEDRETSCSAIRVP